jgi:acyl-CoA dehydrogenase
VRAVGRSGAHKALAAAMKRRLEAADNLPTDFRNRLGLALDRSIALAARVAAERQSEAAVRSAASALYHATSAVLLAWEGSRPDIDARRLLFSRFVLEHRLARRDPLSPPDDVWEKEAVDLVLADGPVSFAQAVRLLIA